MYSAPNWIWCLPLIRVMILISRIGQSVEISGVAGSSGQGGAVGDGQVHLIRESCAVTGIPKSEGVSKAGMKRRFRLRFAERCEVLTKVGLMT